MHSQQGWRCPHVSLLRHVPVCSVRTAGFGCAFRCSFSCVECKEPSSLRFRLRLRRETPVRKFLFGRCAVGCWGVWWSALLFHTRPINPQGCFHLDLSFPCSASEFSDALCITSLQLVVYKLFASATRILMQVNKERTGVISNLEDSTKARCNT